MIGWTHASRYTGTTLILGDDDSVREVAQVMRSHDTIKLRATLGTGRCDEPQESANSASICTLEL